jgi:NAD(P)-dependent dehydrogenase (short-subunit alcohol dehydrogenase family)
MNVAGRVVLLVGATGALGGVVARRLLDGGARIGVAVRKGWQVDQARAAFGPDRVLVGCVPSGDSEAAAGFAKGVNDALGAIDALIATNGAFRCATIGKDRADEFGDLFDANVLGGTTLARAVLAGMRRRQRGRLVFVGSAAVGSGGGGMTNYLATKAALHEWVRALDDELSGSGVRAFAVLPGIIDTEANRAALPTADRRGWHALDEVAALLLQCALGEPPGAGPLLPIPAKG